MSAANNSSIVRGADTGGGTSVIKINEKLIKQEPATGNGNLQLIVGSSSKFSGRHLVTAAAAVVDIKVEPRDRSPADAASVGDCESIATSDDLNGTDDKNSITCREARNRAEKQRRDKLNSSVNELSTMVPHVVDSPKKVDKTAVLRFAAHGLRVDYVFRKSKILTMKRVNEAMTEAFLRMVDSFMITVTCRGNIVVVSPVVEQHLGHYMTDLFGQNLLTFAHPDDHAFLKRQLIPTDLENLFDVHSDDVDVGEPRPRTQEEEDLIDAKLANDKRTFTFRFARAGPRSEPLTYEMVRFDGSFRRADMAPRFVKESTFSAGLSGNRRNRVRDDSIPLHTISSNDIVLVAKVHVIKPPTICDRLLEANKFEYKTRHLIDGQIVQCDQRISIVAGYMSTDVCGLSPFVFMHKDDVRWVIVALRQMYDYSSVGESCYRLLTPTGDFIYLKTRGCLDIDRDTNEVRSFVCNNTMISEDEGRKLIHEMKRKFAIMIQDGDGEFEEGDDTPCTENPIQLEMAVNRMLSNLPNNRSDPDGGNMSSPSDTYASDDQESELGRNIRSPPVRTYVTPQADAIKVAIGKTLKVVETTSGRHSQSDDSSSPALISPNPDGDRTPAQLSNSRTSPPHIARASVLQKTENYRKSPTKQATVTMMPTVVNRHQQKPFPLQSRGKGFGSMQPSPLANAVVQIKEEPLEKRVPPLPTDEYYFERNPQLYSPSSHSGSCASSSSLASPPSFDSVCGGPRSQSFDYINQQLPPSPTSTTNTTNKYIVGSPLLTTSSNNNNNDIEGIEMSGGSPPPALLFGGRLTSVLKRAHSTDNVDSTTSLRLATTTTQATKRKMMNATPMFLGADRRCIDDADRPDISETVPTSVYPALDNCINYYTEPVADDPMQLMVDSGAILVNDEAVQLPIPPLHAVKQQQEYQVVYRQPNASTQQQLITVTNANATMQPQQQSSPSSNFGGYERPR